MKFKAFLKKHLYDSMVLLFLVAGTVSAFIVRGAFSKTNNSNLSAEIYKRSSLIKTIDLSSIDEESEFMIEGSRTEVVIGIKHNAIRIIDSGCPKKYCIHEGWVSEANHPLICAYNDIYIYVGEASFDDVVVMP